MTRDPQTGQFRTQSSESNVPSGTWATNSARAQGPCGSMMSSSFGKALGVVGGAGIGAALMYLMDPNQGAERRHHLADVTGSAFETTGHALRGGMETLGHRAAEAGSAIYSNIPSRRDLGHTGHLLRDRASDAAQSTRHTAGDWLESAREMLPHRRSQRESTISTTTAGIGGLAALAIGVGAMWLFDPSKGRARRAWIGQKATRYLNETGTMMRATGRHLRNKSKGYYYETTSAARHLADKARSGRGSVEPESSAQQRVEPSTPDVSAYRVGAGYQGGAPTGI